jgi:CheY-like chemotaxis protein
VYVQNYGFQSKVLTMDRATAPVLIIGHDLLALGLAALLRARGQRVVVRGGTRAEIAGLVIAQRPAAIIVDLMAARRDDFALLHRLRTTAGLADVPLLVLSPGTIEHESVALERHLRAFDARPMLSPHDLDAVLGELARSQASVA